MKVSSAKSKGRNLQKWVAEKISQITGIEHGKDELISSRGMGQQGTDVILIGKALRMFPFSIECKNQEKWSVHTWINQAIANKRDKTEWMLVAKRNRNKPVVILDADVFFGIYEKLIKKL